MLTEPQIRQYVSAMTWLEQTEMLRKILLNYAYESGLTSVHEIKKDIDNDYQWLKDRGY